MARTDWLAAQRDNRGGGGAKSYHSIAPSVSTSQRLVQFVRPTPFLPVPFFLSQPCFATRFRFDTVPLAAIAAHTTNATQPQPHRHRHIHTRAHQRQGRALSVQRSSKVRPRLRTWFAPGVGGQGTQTVVAADSPTRSTNATECQRLVTASVVSTLDGACTNRKNNSDMPIVGSRAAAVMNACSPAHVSYVHLPPPKHDSCPPRPTSSAARRLSSWPFASRPAWCAFLPGMSGSSLAAMPSRATSALLSSRKSL
jgi:hypothetical protein